MTLAAREMAAREVRGEYSIRGANLARKPNECQDRRPDAVLVPDAVYVFDQVALQVFGEEARPNALGILIVSGEPAGFVLRGQVV
jgi:hypothetical protein